MFGAQNGNYSNEMRAAGFHEDDENNPRTIYVGNLHQSVTEEFIMTLFGQIGEIVKCKILTIADGAMEPYGFIEFKDHKDAAQALTVMNKRLLLEKEMRVNWATQSPNQTTNAALEAYQPGPKVDTSKHFHIFVGDLSPEVDNKQLHDAFLPYGEVSEAKVIRDPQTLKSKGYGFVSFPMKDDAERAIEQMNGAWLGRRSIRTNWASRKGMQVQSGGPSGGGTQFNSARYDEVFNQTGAQNTVVYCGGINPTTNDEQIRAAFGAFGNINEVRIFKNQGYAFVRFETKEQACQAIVSITGTEINGQTVKCSWGRSGDQQSQQGPPIPANYAQYGYGFAGGANQGAQAPMNITGAPPAPILPGQPNFTPQQIQQYWQQYYQYYSSPTVMAHWMNYYQSGGNQNGQ